MVFVGNLQHYFGGGAAVVRLLVRLARRVAPALLFHRDRVRCPEKRADRLLKKMTALLASSVRRGGEQEKEGEQTKGKEMMGTIEFSSREKCIRNFKSSFEQICYMMKKKDSVSVRHAR